MKYKIGDKFKAVKTFGWIAPSEHIVIVDITKTINGKPECYKIKYFKPSGDKPRYLSNQFGEHLSPIGDFENAVKKGIIKPLK